MAAAHSVNSRNLALAAAMLTLCGYQVKSDSLGGTMTQQAAYDIMAAELVLGTGELQTDMEPFFRTYGDLGTCPGPLDGIVATQVAVALALDHG